MKDILLRYFRYKINACPWIDISIIRTERQNLDESAKKLLGLYSRIEKNEDISLMLNELEDKITVKTNLIKICSTCLPQDYANEFPNGPFGLGYGNYFTALPKTENKLNDEEYIRRELELHKNLYPLFVEFARTNKFRNII
ncbi:MAG: hypothetical protein KKA65_04960 [Nanoarchaeota archaeon]|nr:hypothetical protein [Nanoarchaeota archaeon]MCG2719583.1 hypothetical protein [Nanoarchaeota archaeon]